MARSIYQAFARYKGQQTGVTPKDLPLIEEVASSPKPTPKTTKVSQPNKTAKKAEGKPVFKVQILEPEKKLPANSKQFKGLSPVNHYREKGLYKYTYGESTDYNKVLRTKRQIASKFKDAFIVAFKNGEKVNVNEAINEFKRNR